MAFQKIATLDELWSGEMMARECAGQPVLLINTEGTIRAYADACPHLGTRLSAGSLNRNVLACSTHHWEFDVDTGRGINPRTACLHAFAVVVENGDIFVDVNPVDVNQVDVSQGLQR